MKCQNTVKKHPSQLVAACLFLHGTMSLVTARSDLFGFKYSSFKCKSCRMDAVFFVTTTSNKWSQMLYMGVYGQGKHVSMYTHTSSPEKNSTFASGGKRNNRTSDLSCVSSCCDAVTSFLVIVAFNVIGEPSRSWQVSILLSLTT